MWLTCAFKWAGDVIQVNGEDQYALVSGDTTLTAIHAALPAGLQYRAPLLELSVEEWLLSGGVGLLNAPVLRGDVLGLTYRGAHGAVSIGGVVVKNVSGYDLRLVIGSDPALAKPVRLETATLRLRPAASLVTLEVETVEAAIASSLAALRDLGAVYGYAFRSGDAWWVRGEFRADHLPDWGTRVSSAVSVTQLCDALGAFPRVAPIRSALEQALLAAL